MKRDFETLSRASFDLIIIGGGIIGTGIARDAALRGLSTLLVEKDDFACGTTSRSSRLIHGGLRYLRMLDFKLVRQDLRERETLLRIAPHLVHRLRFVIPLLRQAPFYRLTLPAGMRLYQILSRGRSLPSWQRLSPGETLALEPSLAEMDGLVGSYIYYDCQSEFVERLCLENVLSASENGACVVNHAAMTDLLLKDGSVKGIRVRDNLSGESYLAGGRVVLNAGGPWADTIWGRLSSSRISRLRKTKGIHLLTRKISGNALVLIAGSDRRLFFVIPWQGNSLIGTTDTDYYGDPDSVYADSADTDYLITAVRDYFPGFKQSDIYYTTAGLRPLVAADRKAESNTSRAHKIVDHERRNGIGGFISIIGGKITAYRAVAEEAVDLVCGKLCLQLPCRTGSIPLPGAPAVPSPAIESAARENGLPAETMAHLAAIYGSRFNEVLEYVRAEKRMGLPISSGSRDILAQVKHSVIEEEAMTVSDFLLRRSAAGLEPSLGLDALETVSQEMGRLLNWSDPEKQKQMESYRAVVALGRSFRDGSP